MYFDWFDYTHHKYIQYKHFDRTQCRQKGFAPVVVLVGIVVIIAVAAGAYYFGKSQVPKPQTQNQIISQTPQPTSVPSSMPATSSVPTGTDETTNWKTYTNTEHKFSFKYPQSWNISNGNNAVEISNGTYRLRFQSSPYPSIDFDQLYEKPDGTINQNPVFVRTKIKNLEIDGYKATMYSDESTAANQNKSFDISVYLIKGAPITMISGNTDPNSKENLLSIFNQILSTFKFTN